MTAVELAASLRQACKAAGLTQYELTAITGVKQPNPARRCGPGLEESDGAQP